MANKNNFSSPAEIKMPSLSFIKKPDAEVPDPIVETNELAEKEVLDFSESKDNFDFLKHKNINIRRVNFSTSISEETQNNIKKLALSLEININDVVENCINLIYRTHEKQIQKIIRKKLL